jgi:hypothetical protein
MKPATSMRLSLPERNIKLEDCQRAEVEQAFQAVAAQHRYAHHTRMPLRICQSLDYFQVHYDRPPALVKLTVFYLFAGVVDDWLDERRPGQGSLLLARFAQPLPCFTAAVVRSAPLLATEFLKAWVAPDNYLDVLAGLHELYHAVVLEQHAETLQAYLLARRATGLLTADVSYRLIEGEMRPPLVEVRSFMHEVGAVGNVIDSLFDLPGDQRRGVLRFRPTLADRTRLLVRALAGGVRLLARHPQLASLFVAALHDTWQDSWRRGSLGSSRSC